MTLFTRFLLLFCLLPGVATANVATTAGSNLTAWNGNVGVTNNNNWNNMMNSRTQATGPVGEKPKADFGNCNSLIMRCAQPRCSGCTTVEIARPIVVGCVNSNKTCKQHGDELIDFIAAQIVSDINAKIVEQQRADAAAAAQAEAKLANSNQQITQMQNQINNLQNQMQEQNDNQMREIRAALDAQKELLTASNETKSVAGGASSAEGNNEALLGTDNQDHIEDMKFRAQISGQILSEVESAEDALKSLYAAMQTAFRYAGCDERGENCAGPKRVKAFKQKARNFIRPYDQVATAMYNALEMALAVGADVSDVIMMLNGSCNRWGKFMCVGSSGDGTGHQPAYYSRANCQNERSVKKGYAKGGQNCTVGMMIPAHDDVRCTLTEFITAGDEGAAVSSAWIAENEEGDGTNGRLVRLGCATSALESIPMLGRVSGNGGRAAGLDVLERILAQDAPDYAVGTSFYGGENDVKSGTKYCAVKTEDQYLTLLNAIQTKKLPASVCTSRKNLDSMYSNAPMVASYISATSGYVFVDYANWISNSADCTNYIGATGSNNANILNGAGCEMEWNDTIHRCVVKTGGCMFYNNCLLTSADYQKAVNCQNNKEKMLEVSGCNFECVDKQGS